VTRTASRTPETKKTMKTTKMMLSDTTRENSARAAGSGDVEQNGENA